MKISYKWLKEYADFTASPKQLAHDLTMSGSKVEAIECLGDEIEKVVHGRILSIEQHPNADKLVVCTVDVGGDEPVVICTGADNLKTGDYIPVAMNGSKLPNGVSIKKTKMRGVESNGMLCSIGELNLTMNDFPNATEDGILTFDEPTQLGTDVRPYLGLDDTIIEFEITPNRPDCLCAIGLGLETAATYGVPFKAPCPKIGHTEGDVNEYIKVSIQDPDLCRRYTGAIVKDVKIAPSPMWLRQRLRDCGVRPINNIVDITNYVMLEYGQPMHAFDYSCITDREIVARRAKVGETIETLDGNMRELPEGALVIADKIRPIGVAGVMGGANSEITENTKVVVFEAGNFEGVSIRNTSRKLGMRTEASGRFEKGLDSEKTMPAIMAALQLVEQLGAGTIVGGLTDVYPQPKEKRSIKIDYEKIYALIGVTMTNDRVDDILRSLQFEVKDGIALIPYHRDDVEINADLTEEVARIYGFDNIPTTIRGGELTQGGYSHKQKFERSLREWMYSVGFTEALTISFMGDKDLDALNIAKEDSRRDAIQLLNPLGEDQKYMRTTALYSLLEVAQRNYNYRASALSIFEIAKTYEPMIKDGKADMTVLPLEHKVLTVLSYGRGDYYTLKGAIEAALAAVGVKGYSIDAYSENTAYHPGRTAVLSYNNTIFGTIGQIHPVVCKNYGLDTEVYMAEIDVETIYAMAESDKTYKPLPKYPAVTRDLALVCSEETPVAALERAILDAGGKSLESVELFDVFRSPKLGEGKKSVAYSLTLRNLDHTLTDEEADKIIRKALINLETRCGAVIRS